ncbi:MAG: ParB/RepB/Spo0J family partition protein [Candidatus Niyogibacteria bacterium]|nr:ParB/RepB/Spo0J family partition protein [Candidatus Niyogibacteria bacterium]
MPNDYPIQPDTSGSIFSVETDRIKPNPHQPRREFDEQKLKELADSIRAYGILQPLVVIRQEIEVPTGTKVEYELIAGERRLRAAKLAGIAKVPVIIRQEPPERIKLEIALIENVQREDLNPIERAEAFKQLLNNFGLKQKEIADRIGKSREFIANSIRILTLPNTIKEALIARRISEGHTRPLLMLDDRPEEQSRMLDEIIFKKLNVRESEKLARRVAADRARKREPYFDPKVKQMETILSDALGTRVSIERKGPGGRIFIDFFSPEDLHILLTKVTHQEIAPEILIPPDHFKEFEKEREKTSLSEHEKAHIQPDGKDVSEIATAETHGENESSSSPGQHEALSIKDTEDEGQATDEDLKHFSI